MIDHQGHQGHQGDQNGQGPTTSALGSSPADEGATSDYHRMHAVIRFKRAIQFPRFGVEAGERWSFVVYGKYSERLQRLKAGERFDFAGGQCLPDDVEIIYEGPSGLAYSLAAGHLGPALD